MGLGLMVEHHLEQRIMAQAALGLQRFYQLFEGQVLMGLGLQRALLGVLQQLCEGHLAVEIGLEHLSIDEKANQRLGLDAVTVSNRHADADVLLAAVAVKKYLERGEQQHEQGHALALSQGLQAGNQRRLQRYVLACTAKTLLGRARVIERQLQYGLCPAEQLTPVLQLTRLLPCLHPTTLPQRIVRVLNRQRRQHAVLTLAVGSVKLHQLPHHHAHGPAVRDDMVLHHHQYMFTFTEAKQADPQQRTLLQVKRAGDLRFDAGLELGFVNFAFSDVDNCMVQYLLRALFITQVKASTQTFMACDQTVKAALQGCLVQVAAQTQCSGYVIGGAVGVQLPEKPLTLLGVGQRQVLAVFANRGDRQLSETHAPALQALVKLLALLQRQAKKARHQVDIRVGKHGSNRL